ncbi:unnamed protein product, partial [Adineta steineri]
IKHPQKLAVELDEQSLTYCELLYYVQVLSLILLNEYHVVPGDIVCQCVERSLSMVIGMMAIEMVGGVYCPLSSRDPQHRLYALVEQTQSHLILVHHQTKGKFIANSILLHIDLVYMGKGGEERVDVDYLSDILVTSNSIAYIIFTSGSTGLPKAAQIQQRNVTECMHSMVSIDAVNENDVVAQIARCSFDVHVLDIKGTLAIGACEPFTLDLINLLGTYNTEKCYIWNLYGPAETIICTYHHVQSITTMKTIPIGQTMPKYRCLVIDQYLQIVLIRQQGELYVGGVGVFAGYLGRDDLTAKALLEIDSQLFYRTGDLVTLDDNGLIHYQGRKDHQIKLH